jgi:hypothetical protein
MHTHIGAIQLVTAFLGIALVGTLWRISAAHLVALDNPTASNIGKAMAFQY